MSKQYTQKLVRLAKEMIELDKPLITRTETAEVDLQMRDHTFNSKLNYLLGYIMALEEND